MTTATKAVLGGSMAPGQAAERHGVPINHLNFVLQGVRQRLQQQAVLNPPDMALLDQSSQQQAAQPNIPQPRPGVDQLSQQAARAHQSSLSVCCAVFFGGGGFGCFFGCFFHLTPTPSPPLANL